MLCIRSAFGLAQSLIHFSHSFWCEQAARDKKLASILTPSLYFLYHRCQFKCRWKYRDPDNRDSHSCHELSVCFCYHLLLAPRALPPLQTNNLSQAETFATTYIFCSFHAHLSHINVCTMLDFAVIKQNSLPKESTKTTTWSQAAGNIWKTILHLDAVSFIYFSFASLFLFYTVDSKF